MGLFKSKEEKQKERKQLIDVLTRWSGSKPSDKLEIDFYIHQNSLIYADQHVLRKNEQVLQFIGADYGKLEDTKFNGVLILADSRLLYVNKEKNSQFTQDWNYNKLNGVKVSGYPLKAHEFQIEVGKSKKVFHRVNKKEQFNSFIDALQNKISNAESTPTKRKTVSNPSNKYKQLEQIAKLKEQVILTEEEFQSEKTKILNN